MTLRWKKLLRLYSRHEQRSNRCEGSSTFIRSPQRLCCVLVHLKTDVVIGAISNYLGCEEDVSLHQRVNELEKRLTQLENILKMG
jgi:hypothetical protein